MTPFKIQEACINHLPATKQQIQSLVGRLQLAADCADENGFTRILFLKFLIPIKSVVIRLRSIRVNPRAKP